jgi:aminoglycoside phosphotransferase (APT) family kinase protein
MTDIPADSLRDPHLLDTVRLTAWLRANVDDFKGTLSAEKFAGGQSNPTYALSIDGEKRYVLRRKPSGAILPSAHAVDREFRVANALRNTDVPVAKMFALCNDTDVIGSMFYVMEFVAGRSFWDPRLPEIAHGERDAYYAEMNRVIAALHTVDPEAIGLGDFGKPGNYFARQIARWSKQYRAAETEHIEAMENLLAWLPAQIPADDRSGIVHGDYRIDNLLFHPREPRIVAVIDWELSTLGHPLADFAYHVMAWRLSHAQFRGLADTDLAALNIPDEQTYLNGYLQKTRSNFEQSTWEFAIAYNLFRVACIRQGILKRALEGNASNTQALEAGSRARAMAEVAWQQVERIQQGRFN